MIGGVETVEELEVAFQPDARFSVQDDDALARLEAVEPVERGDQAGKLVIGGVEAFEEGEVVLQRDARLRVQDIDLPRAFGLVAACRPRSR